MQSIAYRRHGNPEDGPGLGLRLREMQKSCYPSAAGLAPGKMRSGGKKPSDCRILHGLVAIAFSGERAGQQPDEGSLAV